MALNERYHMMVEKCLNSLKTWQTIIHENLNGEEQDTEIKKLEKIAKEYCIIDNNHKKAKEALKIVQNNIQESGSSGNKDYDVDKMFKEALNEQEDEETTENEIWQTLFKNNESVRVIKQKKKKDTSHYEEVIDESVLCSTAFTAPVDPISKVVIRNPVRNRKCHHIYDSASIYGYIRQSKRRAKCPYMGCNNNNLTSDDLVEDAALATQITQYLQTQQQEDKDESDSSD